MFLLNILLIKKLKNFNHVIQRKEHKVVFKTIPYMEPQCLFSEVVSLNCLLNLF